MTELKPCRACGAPCRVETFKSETISASLWLCSDASVFGGKCPETDGYISEEAWNTRATPRTDGDDGELVERLEHGMAFDIDVGFHGVSAEACETSRQAAARITALSAEVERLKAYVQHKGGCRRGIWPDLTPTPPCDCGLSEALGAKL